MKEILDAILKVESSASERAIEAQNEAMAIIAAARQAVIERTRGMEKTWLADKEAQTTKVREENNVYVKELEERYSHELGRLRQKLDKNKEAIRKEIFRYLTGRPA